MDSGGCWGDWCNCLCSKLGQLRQTRKEPAVSVGFPQVLRTDNGPEFLGEAFVQWSKSAGMAIQYIQPGKPNQNAYIERFNRTLRDELLDQHLLVEARIQRRPTSRLARRPHAGRICSNRQELYFRSVALTGKLTHEADDPNAFVDFLDADALTGQNGRNVDVCDACRCGRKPLQRRRDHASGSGHCYR